MLLHLHVKNLALIREAEIDFAEGLNILTGETGAGKSILIGSMTMALGGKVSKEMKQYAKKKKYELMTNFYLKSGKDRFWVMKPLYEENILEGRIYRYHAGKIKCVFKFQEP